MPYKDAAMYGKQHLVLALHEEVQDPSSSPRREEVGRRTLRDYGGFLPSFFYRDRFQTANWGRRCLRTLLGTILPSAHLAPVAGLLPMGHAGELASPTSDVSKSISWIPLELSQLITDI